MLKGVSVLACFTLIVLLIACNSNSRQNPVCATEISAKKLDWFVLYAKPIHIPSDFMAIRRSDSDIAMNSDTTGERVALPDKVREKVEEIVNSNDFPRLFFTSNDCVFQIYNKDSISLFVFRDNIFGEENLYLIGYDANKEVLFDNVPVFFAGWMLDDEAGFEPMYRLIRKPYTGFEDVDGDGQPELFVKERIHNGNLINGVVTHYYVIDRDDIVFRHLVNIESVFVSDFMKEKPDYITRRLVNGEILTHISQRGLFPDELMGCAKLQFNHDRQVVGIIFDKKQDSSKLTTYSKEKNAILDFLNESVEFCNN